ncbi:MAG: tetratricopeptide repeat protein [Moorea sp. SIO2B7]|nr:tetratricopeptide repeat protein [Moorena sp. SIO2B7]
MLSLRDQSKALEAFEESIRLLEEIEQVEGGEQIKDFFSVAYSSKGRALREMRKYKQALQAYDKALEYQGNYFPALRDRGITLKGLKQYKQAIAQFDQILNDPKLTNGRKAETLYYKGLTLCEARNYRGAIASFEDALKVKPDYKAAKTAKRNCTK